MKKIYFKILKMYFGYSKKYIKDLHVNSYGNLIPFVIYIISHHIGQKLLLLSNINLKTCYLS